MGDLLLGLTITVILFALIHIAEKRNGGNIDDLTDEEREWFNKK